MTKRTPELTPLQSATIATNAYAVNAEDLGSPEIFDLGIDGIFELRRPHALSSDDESAILSSRTGPMFFRDKRGFGFIAEGKGEFEGDVLVSMRGTEGWRDWVTDGNFALTVARGQIVHSGFNNTFKLMEPMLSEYMSRRKERLRTVHCVGHSLGGALATMTADLYSEARVPCKLYTFGCPRVGDEGFARKLSRNVGGNNMFRVYNSGDPVPMVPLFPYVHTPVGDLGIELDRNFLTVNPWAHRMKKAYKAPIAEHTEWESLRRATAARDWEQQAIALLDRASESGGIPGGFMGSMTLLLAIRRVLRRLIKQVLSIGVGLPFLGAVTILDYLARMLESAVTYGPELASQAKTAINMIFTFLGRTWDNTVSLTRQFLSWVLRLLFNSVRDAVLAAMGYLNA